MKHALSILIFLSVSQFALSQNTILWKVNDTANNKTSFIVGTFHQFGNSFVDSIPEIKESLLNSDIAIFESIDKREDTRIMIENRVKSFEIEKNLKKKDLKKLKEIAKNWKVDLYKLKPLEIRWKLQQEFQRIKCKTTKPSDEFDHFDKYLQYIAEENEIEVLGLETDSLQLKLIEKQNKKPNWKRERQNISDWIYQMTTDKPDMNNCRFTNKYRKFDLEYQFEIECKNDIVFLQRNEKWMKIIPNLLKNKNTFIAVGYGHLIKKCGILEQLKSKGFKIEPVKISR